MTDHLARAELVKLSIDDLLAEARRLQREVDTASVDRQREIVERLGAITDEADLLSASMREIRRDQLITDTLSPLRGELVTAARAQQRAPWWRRLWRRRG